MILPLSDDVGDEFDWNVNRIADQIGANDEPHFELGRVDVGVARDLNECRRKSRLVS